MSCSATCFLVARSRRPASEWGISFRGLDGKVMENGRHFQVNLYPRAVGDVVELEVLRRSARLTFSAAPVERPSDPDRFRTMVRPNEHLVSQLGILGLSLDADVASMLPPLRRQRGCGRRGLGGWRSCRPCRGVACRRRDLRDQPAGDRQPLGAARGDVEAQQGRCGGPPGRASRAADVSGLQAGVGTPARSVASLVMTLPRPRSRRRSRRSGGR